MVRTELALFVSERGDVSARAQAEYQLLLTRRLILEPRLELNLSATDSPRTRTGSGLGTTEAGPRLRYEIRHELAPYVGIRWEGLYGDTRALARADGEPDTRTFFVIGIRVWF